MAQTITLALITFIFVVLGFNERNFLANAQQHSATILKVFTSITTDDVALGESHRDIAKKATVQLAQSLTDKRQGDVVVPLPVWETLKIGDTIQVLAYSEHPKWVFWSPMIRYKHREVFVKLNSILTAFFLLMTMLSLYAMRT